MLRRILAVGLIGHRPFELGWAPSRQTLHGVTIRRLAFKSREWTTFGATVLQKHECYHVWKDLLWHTANCDVLVYLWL